MLQILVGYLFIHEVEIKEMKVGRKLLLVGMKVEKSDRCF